MQRQARIQLFGLGKLGLPLAALLARGGNHVLGIDTDRDHIERLKAGTFAADEPGLPEVLHQANENIVYSADVIDFQATVSIIHVPTPSDKEHPQFSSALVEQAVETACAAVVAFKSGSEQHLVVIASTLMPGTLEARIRPVLHRYDSESCRFGLAYVPDFVAIGDVIRGFQSPTTLIIGSDTMTTADRAETIYRTILQDNVPVARMKLSEAELTKVAWNAYLCMKIDFANLISRLAQAHGDIDVDRVLNCLSRDTRVGRGFLKPGMPFGGPCLSRDADALVALCDTLDCDSSLGRGIRDANDEQIRYIVDLLMSGRPKRVAVLGLGFKSGSDVTFLSPSFMVMREVLERDVTVSAYDPSPRARHDLKSESWATEVAVFTTIAEAVAEADAILVAVEDARYASLVDLASDKTRIVDPWGCVSGSSPGLLQPGRGRDPSAVQDISG